MLLASNYSMLLAAEQTKALMLLLLLVTVDEDTAVMCTALVNGQPPASTSALGARTWK
jgi:hypothetical protein